MQWQESHDIVIIGSGAAGVTAAIAAARRGLKPVIFEKAPVWGGTTALSGGGLWIPDNAFQRAAGVGDNIEDALAYMEEILEGENDRPTRERQRAFLEQGPHLVDMLTNAGFEWTDSPQPDYVTKPHAWKARGLDMKVVDGRKLGPMLATMRRAGAPMAIMIKDIPLLSRGFTTLTSTFTMARVFIENKLRGLIGQQPLGCGESLIGQLMIIARDMGIPVRLNAALSDIVIEDGRAVGVVVEEGGESRTIEARGGIFLCAGGFAHAAETRQKLQGTDGYLSSASRQDTGDALTIGERIGAATAMLDAAWWGSAFRLPGLEDAVFCLSERSLPYSIVVDDKGERFVNEAVNYYAFGKALRRKEIESAWLIIEARHRSRYMFCGMLPGQTPQGLLDAGFFIKADSLAEIAEKCGIDAKGLASTVTRFNGFAKTGRDEDFGRGEGAYDRFWGDPTMKPNPNLGPIEQGPYLATKIWLGDLGTKGGILTDEHARVLHESGQAIAGLYAAGNTTASVFGRSYPGPGATLGPAMTFAYIGANHAADTMSASAA
jgi:3-oxosteroid 1-dehydrogenase